VVKIALKGASGDFWSEPSFAFSGIGVSWLLGTDGLEKIGYSLVKETRTVADLFLEKYKKFVNWVYKKNCKAMPFGVYGKNCYFWKEKRPSLGLGL